MTKPIDADELFALFDGGAFVAEIRSATVTLEAEPWAMETPA